MPQPITQNALFNGDNLDILREYIPDSSVDLVYLDPAFNSSRYARREKGPAGIPARASPA